MKNKKYPDFIDEISNYLIGIGNYSKLYVENIITTIMQFLEFMNTYKFNEQFDSLDKITTNDIRSLSKSDIYSFIYYLADNNYKEGTRILKLEHLRTFFDYMFRIKHSLFKEPFKEIKREKRCSRQLPNYLSLEEAKKVVTVYQDSDKEQDIRDTAILNVFLTCGLRLSEIQNLEISNINFKENKFTIIGKGNKERMCYLNTMTKKAILKYLELRNNMSVENKEDKKILFLSNRNRKLGRNTIKQIVKRAYDKAGLNQDLYSVHTLRHTCATLLLKNGTDIKIIKEILGHARIETTQLYTHIYNKNVEKAMFEHPLSKFKMQNALAYTA
jgi:site-specific recombinase XerD